MTAAYYAEKSAALYALAVEIEVKDSRDPHGINVNIAVSYARMAGATLRGIAKSLAEEERNMEAKR